MRRRLIVLVAVLCAAALGVTAVALAHGGGGRDGDRGKDATTHAKPRHARGGPAPFFAGRGLFGVVLGSLAGRLEVKPADLRKAVREVVAEQRAKRLQAAGLTPAEIAALKSCRRPGHGLRGRDGRFHKRDGGRGPRPRKPGAGCDTGAAKSAIAKLQAAAKTKPDLVALKAELAQSLATKLGKTPEQVLAAVRAELDARLTQAVMIGLVSQKGHDLALACFDDPATCDLAALKAQVTFPGHRGDRKSDRHDGRMHPGARRHGSHPLR